MRERELKQEGHKGREERGAGMSGSDRESRREREEENEECHLRHSAFSEVEMIHFLMIEKK